MTRARKIALLLGFVRHWLKGRDVITETILRLAPRRRGPDGPQCPACGAEGCTRCIVSTPRGQAVDGSELFDTIYQCMDCFWLWSGRQVCAPGCDLGKNRAKLRSDPPAPSGRAGRFSVQPSRYGINMVRARRRRSGRLGINGDRGRRRDRQPGSNASQAIQSGDEVDE